METTPNIFFDLRRLKYLGAGALVGRTVRIRKPEEVVIGDHSIIDDFTYISCALHVGRHSHIAPNVTISGGSGSVVIGDLATIAAGSSLHAASSDYTIASLDLPSVPIELRFGGTVDRIQIGSHCILGAHTCVLPGVDLPEGVATGAFTLLNRQRYEPWTLYGGIPARRLRARDHAKLDRLLEENPQLTNALNR